MDSADRLALAILAATTVLAGIVIWNEYHRDTYPTSTNDCPPQHIYIDWGETPQAGCWPEGAARELGTYPKPEEP